MQSCSSSCFSQGIKDIGGPNAASWFWYWVHDSLQSETRTHKCWVEVDFFSEWLGLFSGMCAYVLQLWILPSKELWAWFRIHCSLKQGWIFISWNPNICRVYDITGKLSCWRHSQGRLNIKMITSCKYTFILAASYAPWILCASLLRVVYLAKVLSWGYWLRSLVQKSASNSLPRRNWKTNWGMLLFLQAVREKKHAAVLELHLLCFSCICIA